MSVSFIKKSGKFDLREIYRRRFFQRQSTIIEIDRWATSSFCKQGGKQAVDEIAQFEMHLFYSLSGANHRERN